MVYYTIFKKVMLILISYNKKSNKYFGIVLNGKILPNKSICNLYAFFTTPAMFK